MSGNLWIETAIECLKLPITHLSAYNLTIEPKTVLYRQYQQNKFNLPSDRESLKQFEHLIEIAKNREFYLYEISNFAKKGMESKHNSAYWKHVEYIGFGPSAHSFYNNSRTYNINNIKKYLDGINKNTKYYEEETLSKTQLINETLMLSLRTVKGLDLENFERKFGSKELKRIKTRIKPMNKKLYKIQDNFLSLTTKGLFVSDSIISSLFKM